MVTGIGRTWVDEILHTALLSPFKRGNDLSEEEAERLRAAMVSELGRVVDVYEEQVAMPLPEKFPKPTACPQPPGRALPTLRRRARGRLLRGLRHDLLPAVPDGGPRPQGPPALEVAQVIAEGERAPDFTLPDQDGEPVTLSDLAGRPVVLYFYPKADTPGCTTQACGVRDHLPDYEEAGAVVIGVSPDPVKRVKKFHDKQGLNFTLLADEDHAVCDLYGVWGEKSMYGKTYWGAQRATFVIDADGTVAPRDPEGVAEDARRGRAGGARGADRGLVLRPELRQHLGVLVVRVGAPMAMISAPSDPASIPRGTEPGTRMASNWASSTMSSPALTRALPEITT